MKAPSHNEKEDCNPNEATFGDSDNHHDQNNNLENPSEENPDHAVSPWNDDAHRNGDPCYDASCWSEDENASGTAEKDHDPQNGTGKKTWSAVINAD